MINRSKKLQGLVLGSLLLSVSAEAFDILASYTPMNEQKYKSATNNVGLEIGHYKNSDKKGFGFGWRLAATKPMDAAWLDGGTAEVGIAPGYTIIEDLDINLELGLGLHSYNSYDVAVGGYGGLGISYAAWSHLYLGAAARNWIMDVLNSNDNGTKDSYSDLRTTSYIGYRF